MSKSNLDQSFSGPKKPKKSKRRTKKKSKSPKSLTLKSSRVSESGPEEVGAEWHTFMSPRSQSGYEKQNGEEDDDNGRQAG
jgi:hypothetical protein